jgi:hypothetical protein
MITLNDAEFGNYLERITREIKSADGEGRLESGWRFLEAMGLEEFVGCDLDICDILDHIPSGSDFVDVQCYLQHTLVEALLDNLQSGGTSILLDIHRMKSSPASVLIPLIERQRKEKLSRTQLYVVGREMIQCDVFMKEATRTVITRKRNPVFLENLWLTSAGYQILTDLGMGLCTNMKGLKQIQRLLKKAGIDIAVRVDSDPITNPAAKMSSSLRDLILRRTRDSLC